ncbi:MAG: phosphoglucomutase/phosphomannomutase family protein [Anaerolineales bacterium]|nr:phosphoglucomutase/phosphomannomutase family protein [Anaerolineales bacterium]MDW8447305.1 phosphoglucomutase/phosphomannomutase family protein [Anaerolineales bacterium]
MLQIKFGTDGWRGVIAEDYTFLNVRRCAQGFANFLEDYGYGGREVVIGYDRRFHSENFAAAAAEVMAGNGFGVWLTQDATPTPVIAYSIVNKGAAGGINITASHNPPTDNGFKVRNEFGGAIDPMGLVEIEKRIPDNEREIRRIPLDEAQRTGKVRFFDPAPPYIQQLQSLVDFEKIRRAGLRVCVDPMWGNGSGWFPRLLSGGETQIIEIHNQRNPIFPGMKRPEPIPPNINEGLRAVLETQSDVLIVTDGDADRVGLGDEKGNFVDQLRVFGLLAYYLLEVRGLRGPIVKTLSTTTILNKLGKIYGVPVYETGVGFKYVAPKMLETHAMIGGEESGGFAFHGHVPERDGILAALYLLDMMVELRRKPSGLVDLLFSIVGPHYYARVDTPFEGNRQEYEAKILAANPTAIAGLAVTGLDTTDGYKFWLEDGGWLLIRFSGTEPIIRVYTETMHADRVDSILQDGLKIAGVWESK